MADSATQKPTQQSREADISKLALELKKLNESSKREGMERLAKSPNKTDRELAESFKNSLASDTATMFENKEGTKFRVGPDGRPVVPEIKKVESKKSGGMTASSRADGCCQRGKTRGKMV